MKKLQSKIAIAAIISIWGFALYAKPAKNEPNKNGAKVPYKTLKITKDGVEVRRFLSELVPMMSLP